MRGGKERVQKGERGLAKKFHPSKFIFPQSLYILPWSPPCGKYEREVVPWGVGGRGVQHYLLGYRPPRMQSDCIIRMGGSGVALKK